MGDLTADRGHRADERFRVLEELGRGAVGVVYRAVEVATGREVALKVLLERPDPTRLARFEREGQVTAALDHPGVVRVHAAGALGGQPFLAYELVPGGETFADARGQLDRSTRLRLLRDAAAAVGHAHARGVVHRDLKPANVLVDRSSGGVPRVRVADFGMARLTSDTHERLTRTGVIVGTPHYMAPEQAAGEREVGAPADVWALGVMLYEALLDELPFDGESLQVLLARICAVDPRPPREVDPALAPDLEAIVLRALERDPASRYPDAAALADDLEAFLRGEAVGARRGSIRRWLRRRRGPLLASGAVALSVGAVTGAALATSSPTAPQAAPAAPTAPTIHVLAPDDGATMTEATVVFEVRVDDPDDRFVEVQVGGRAPLRVAAGRPFTTRVEVAQGANRVAVRARDAAGHEARVERALRVEVTPGWWASLDDHRRPALPLPSGLRFGEGTGEYVNERDGSLLVWVPPGHFTMGSPQPGEGPPHEVRLTRGLFMGKHEVTWGQYRRFCQETGRALPRPPSFAVTDEHPVVNVELEDCLAYCAWAGLRLPTEAEWEWAARGADGRLYPWGDHPPRPHDANIANRDRFEDTSPVGSFPAGASPWGCLDMAGNAFEWTADGFAPHPSTPQVDPVVPPEPGRLRVVKGGAFELPEPLARSTGRTEGWASECQGFRACRSP